MAEHDEENDSAGANSCAMIPKSHQVKDTGAGMARAWRGRGAGRQLLAWVARTWRGHGAGLARACPATPGTCSVTALRVVSHLWHQAAQA
eukprot:gene13362-biopygen8014